MPRLWVAGLALLVAACSAPREASPSLGDEAPSFTLPAAAGGQVAVADYLGKRSVLLYFNMAYG